MKLKHNISVYIKLRQQLLSLIICKGFFYSILQNTEAYISM